MQQLSLVQLPKIAVLADDPLGTIVYHRDVFSREQTDAWFQVLRSSVAWRDERREMYDRVVDVPRLVASYALDEAEEVPEPIRFMRPVVERISRVAFQSAGLNFYRDGNDSVAPHGDHVERGPKGAPVALVSLGETRRMTIRSKAKPVKNLDLDLVAGSLLIMSYASHFNYLHGIPKSKSPVGPRISVAFRQAAAKR